MDTSEQIQLKTFSTRVSGGVLDDVTGEYFGPCVTLRLCNRALTKFFNVRITDMFAMPMVVFVSGHDYKRPAVTIARAEFDTHASEELFRRRVGENCARMCLEIETAFQNVQCDACHTGVLVQSAHASLFDTLRDNRIHRYAYGTLVTLRLSFNNEPHIMDMDTYASVYRFIRENGARGIYQVLATSGDPANYVLKSIKAEYIGRATARGKHSPPEVVQPANDYANGYRTHSIDLSTTAAQIDKYEYDDIMDGDTVECDYDSWLDSPVIQFNSPPWAPARGNTPSAVHVKFSITLADDGSLTDISVAFVIPLRGGGADNDSGRSVVISYARSVKTRGAPALILLYFINDTHYGLNRPPMINRRAYCAVFIINHHHHNHRGPVTKRKFIRKLITCANTAKVRNALEGKIDNVTGDMFTFDSGAAVEYMDHPGITDTRTAMRHTSDNDLPLRDAVCGDVSAAWYRNAMERLCNGVFVPAGRLFRENKRQWNVGAARGKKDPGLISDNDITWPEAVFQNSEIALIKRPVINACLKHNLSPGNVFFMRASDVINAPWYGNISKFARVYEYDPNSARKYNIPWVYRYDGPTRKTDAGDMVMVVGMMNDVHTQFIKTVNRLNDPRVDSQFKNRFVDGTDPDFKTAVYFITDVETQRYGHRVSDRLYVLKNDGRGVTARAQQQQQHKPLLFDLRVLAGGDVILNGKNLVLNDENVTGDHTAAVVEQLKTRSVQIMGELNVTSPACCVRAIAHNFPDLLTSPVPVDVTIERCFGRHFRRDTDTETKLDEAVARVFKNHRAAIGDAVVLSPAISALTDDHTLVLQSRATAASHRNDYTHYISKDLVRFLDNLFGTKCSVVDNRTVAASICITCKNFKCRTKINRLK